MQELLTAMAVIATFAFAIVLGEVFIEIFKSIFNSKKS